MVKIAEKEFMAVLVQDHHNFDLLLDRLSRWNCIALDTETTGLNSFLGDRIAGIAIYIPNENTAFYLAFRHALGNNLPLHYMQELFEVLYGKTLQMWNGKFDLHMLTADGFDPQKIKVQEGMTALHLLDENRRDHGMNYKLKDVAKQFIDAKAADSDEALQEKLKAIGLKKGLMYQLDSVDVADYAMTDTILTHLLIEFFKPYMDKWLVTDLWNELNDFILVLWRIEHNGMVIDRDLCINRISGLEVEARECLQAIREKAGFEINPSSPQQVAAWLGISNAQAKTLEEIAQRGDERAELILKYKTTIKADTTFYQPYLNFSEGDGKVHPTYHVAGPVTGRLSASDPNPQQTPHPKKYPIRDVFVAPEGYVFVQFDYSQQELRLAAHYSQDERLIQAYLNDEDVHQLTADHVGIDRKSAKNYNFATIYGAGARKLAWMTGDTEARASANLSRFDALYPSLRSFARKVTLIAQQDRNPDGSYSGKYGFIRLMDGRCRHFNHDGKEYSAFNSLIQGTGAIIMRRALMKVCKEFPIDDEVIPNGTIHDSALFYIKQNENLAGNIVLIQKLMQSFSEFNPPMIVDVEVGSLWGRLYPYTRVIKEWGDPKLSEKILKEYPDIIEYLSKIGLWEIY